MSKSVGGISGSTWIHTINGPYRANDDKISEYKRKRPFAIVSNGEFYATKSKGFYRVGTLPVYRVTTAKGFSVVATQDTQFLVLVPKRPQEQGTPTEEKQKEEKEWLPLNKLIKLFDQNKRINIHLSNHSNVLINEKLQWGKYLEHSVDASGAAAARLDWHGATPYMFPPGWMGEEIHHTSFRSHVGFAGEFLSQCGSLKCSEPYTPCEFVADHPCRHNLKQIQLLLIRVGVVSSIRKNPYFFRVSDVGILLGQTGQDVFGTWSTLQDLVPSRRQLLPSVMSNVLESSVAGAREREEHKWQLLIKEDEDGLIPPPLTKKERKEKQKKKEKRIIPFYKSSLWRAAYMLPKTSMADTIIQVQKTRSLAAYNVTFDRAEDLLKQKIVKNPFIDTIVSIELLEKDETVYNVSLSSEKGEFCANGIRVRAAM